MGKDHRETGEKGSRSGRLLKSQQEPMLEAHADSAPDSVFGAPPISHVDVKGLAKPPQDLLDSPRVDFSQDKKDWGELALHPPMMRRWRFWLEEQWLQFAVAMRRDLEQRRALFLWGCVVMALGAAVYMHLPDEPILPVLMAACCGVVALTIRQAIRGHPHQVSFLLAMGLIGLTLASLHGNFLTGPVLQSSFSATVTGIVERVELRPKDERWTVRIEEISGLTKDALPRKLLLTRRGTTGGFAAGDRISARARLVPLSRPVLPGGFDYGRYLWARGIGGQGYLSKSITKLPENGGPGWSDRFQHGLEQTRSAIALHIAQRLSGDTAGLATALSVGKRDALSDNAKEALRQSGLAHILAISGLHMALVSLSVFAGLRFGLALLPGLALRYPIKKWAALAALLVATGYLCLSGFAVSTMRAYVMTAIFLVAVLVGRPAFTLHNLALALICLLILQPLAVVEAGMQMSFAATAALIAGYERLRHWRANHEQTGIAGPWLNGRNGAVGVVGRLSGWGMGWLGGVMLTALLAGVAVLPFSLVHFQQMAPLGLLANVLAMPLVSFIVMPLGLIAFLLVPFGLQSLPMFGAAWGLEQILSIAHWVSSLSPIDLLVGSGHWSLSLVAVLVLAILTIHRSMLAFVSLGLIVLPLLAQLLEQGPDLWLSQKGNAIAFRDEVGDWQFSGSRLSGFEAQALLRADGDSRALSGIEPIKRTKTLKASTPQPSLMCDVVACRQTGEVYIDGKPVRLAISFVRKAEAFAEDCLRNDLIVSPLTIPHGCNPALGAYGKDELERMGAQFLWLKRAKRETFSNGAKRLSSSDHAAAGPEEIPSVRIWEMENKAAVEHGRRLWQIGYGGAN